MKHRLKGENRKRPNVAGKVKQEAAESSVITVKTLATTIKAKRFSLNAFMGNTKSAVMEDISMKPIPVNTPKFWGEEKDAMVNCIETGWISSEGPAVKEFESAMATFCGRKHGIACSNGTAAIDMAIKSIGLGKGDEVIMPAFCIISCITEIVRCGALPVLVDSDASFNMNVQDVAKRVTSATKAILVVHTYHFAVDMDPILQLAKDKGLRVIEDSAELIGCTYKGRKCGGMGDISTMSFYPNKHITTGEGGMVLTDDDDLADRARKARNLWFDPKKRRFVHDELGWNYRMTNLQAALGVAQLKYIDEALVLKRKIGRMYNDLLKGCPGLILPPNTNAVGDENIFWIYGVEVKPEIKVDAEEVMKQLAAAKVGTRPFFWPMHEQPVFQNMGLFSGETYPVAERIARRGFYIPSGMGLSDAEIQEVARRVRQVMEAVVAER